MVRQRIGFLFRRTLNAEEVVIECYVLKIYYFLLVLVIF